MCFFSDLASHQTTCSKQDKFCLLNLARSAGKTDQLIVRWPTFMTNGTRDFSVWTACMPGKIETNANGTLLSNPTLRRIKKMLIQMKNIRYIMVYILIVKYLKRSHHLLIKEEPLTHAHPFQLGHPPYYLHKALHYFQDFFSNLNEILLAYGTYNAVQSSLF